VDLSTTLSTIALLADVVLLGLLGLCRSGFMRGLADVHGRVSRLPAQRDARIGKLEEEIEVLSDRLARLSGRIARAKQLDTPAAPPAAEGPAEAKLRLRRMAGLVPKGEK